MKKTMDDSPVPKKSRHNGENHHDSNSGLEQLPPEQSQLLQSLPPQQRALFLQMSSDQRAMFLQVLQQKEEENKVLHGQLQQEKEENKRRDKKGSVKILLERKLPEMAVNTAAKPSIIPNSEARRRTIEYRTNQDKDKKLGVHEPAEIMQWRLQEEFLDGFKLHITDEDGDLIKSRLSLAPINGTSGILAHNNEQSPQDYLSDAIADMCSCCGVLNECKVVKEATLFSMRPDLVVVLVEGRILFAVEVKNPGKPLQDNSNKEETGVFTSISAGGQTLDYLKAIKQQGIDWPFVLLSTYNETVIAVLPDDQERYQSILKKGSENAESLPPKRHTNPQDKRKVKEMPSPKQKRMQPSSLPPAVGGENINGEDVEEEDDSDSAVVEDVIMETVATQTDIPGDFDYRGRKVLYSQIFEVQKLFQVITLVLESSLVSLNNSKDSVNPLLPEECSELKPKERCMLTPGGFTFKSLTVKKVTYLKPPRENMVNCWVLCQLGQGGSGKTILCSSYTGKLFAVKLFLVKEPTSYDEKERLEDKEKQVKEKQKEAQEERNRWHALAPEYKGFCRVKELNCLPALTMPYFAPVPYDRREEALPLVKKKLEDIAKKGYYYEKQDLRWRHFGCRFDTDESMKITLLDLGSLVKLVDTDPDGLVETQIDELKRRMSDTIGEPKVPLVANK